jgi:hypothetical protein
MGSRQIVLVSTEGISVLNEGIFWREAKTKRLFSQCTQYNPFNGFSPADGGMKNLLTTRCKSAPSSVKVRSFVSSDLKCISFKTVTREGINVDFKRLQSE